MSSALTIFEACRIAIDDDQDRLGLLQCVSSHLEEDQVVANENLRSYLLLLSGALVFFMQAGFAMLCAGSVRRKNARNTMLKNLLDAAGAAISYFCVGYAFAFGGDGQKTGTTFIGLQNFFGQGDIDLPFYFFQYTFFAATVTIVAGTLAERCQMAAYLGYSMALTGFVYPVVAHAVWSTNGFLSPTNAAPLFGIGMVDFSGSGVVHLTGGTTALYATMILGSRRGRFYDVATGQPLDVPKPFPGHSVSLQMLGSLILWFGWFGFNPGTALLLSGNPHQAEVGALCAVNTFLSSSAGCVSALILNSYLHYRDNGEVAFDLVAAMNGTLTGLVAITGGCAVLELWGALLVGAVAGALYLFGSSLLVRFKIDDAVDAVPVHCFGGTWGLLALGLLAEPTRMLHAYDTNKHPGFLYSLADGSPDGRLLACQICGILFIVGWTFFTMVPFFLWLNFMGWFRSGSIHELVGLDITYNLADDGNVADEGNNKSAGTADDMEEAKYMDAYEKYRHAMRENRERNAGSDKSMDSD